MVKGRKNALESTGINNRKPAISWVIETPGFFRNRKLRIFAEEVVIIDGAALLITLNAQKGFKMGIAAGSWTRFYPEATKQFSKSTKQFSKNKGFT
jgi:hypothetical protein